MLVANLLHPVNAIAGNLQASMECNGLRRSSDGARQTGGAM